MKKFIYVITIFLGVYAESVAQKVGKKPLTHEAYKIWNKIEKPTLSTDGRWSFYQLTPGEGDYTIVLHDNEKGFDYHFFRGSEAQLSADNQYFVFKLKPFADTLKAQRRRKVKDADLPKDTLCLYSLSAKKISKFPNVKSYKMPEKWAGVMAFLREPEKEKVREKESKKVGESEKVSEKESAKGKEKKRKEESKDNGSRLSLWDFAKAKETNFDYVKDYIFAEEGHRMLLTSSGDDSLFKAGVYYLDADKAIASPILTAKKGNFKNISISKSGKYAAFVADIDTSKTKPRYFDVYQYQEGEAAAKVICVSKQNAALPKDWTVSENATPIFSKNEKRLRFGIAPPPIVQDTTLLPEEIVNVEVWNYEEPSLYTQQAKELEEYKKRFYPVVYDLENAKTTYLIQDDSSKIARFDSDFNLDNVLILNDYQYRKESSWLGYTAQNVYLKNLKTGILTKVATATDGNVKISPAGKYVYWFCPIDSSWLLYQIDNQRLTNISAKVKTQFLDELNDVPAAANSYGAAGWLKDDAALLLYDRYDIWKIDPTGASEALNLTKGRERKNVYRYIALDREKTYIETEQAILLHYVKEDTKGEGFATFDLKTNQLRSAHFEPDMALTQQVVKAKNANVFLFTKENFKTFPDLQLANNQDFKNSTRISNANPQQANHSWGSVELYTWISLDGQRLTGMLFKPEGFDAKQKYPMIVNFYERSSQDLNLHRIPTPNRSNINYSFYASRGYVVFNPDIPYREGYPGESAMSAIIPGVSSLIDKGFVDAQHIGIQGHSWGGYQTAYIVTKTNMFKCAESGAPVSNMTSAYGGIRWESGLVREFQYEHGQSRIGGTLWQYPLRYLENSPIFFADKIQTPLLILHNDKDGAVPWYQGIELFTAMRRLNKPSWLLNYNDEPHWPVKWQNRVDFNIRMQQYFDHYLKGEPAPDWMKRGVPALEKGIRQGY
jgi:dipeptidyl aminopeptidase/acylaminoacyl peptidase